MKESFTGRVGRIISGSEMRDKLKRLAAVREESAAAAAGNGAAHGARSSVASRLARAEDAFDRIMERQTGLPGRATSQDAVSAAKLAELEERARNNRQRLAAVKGSSGKS